MNDTKASRELDEIVRICRRTGALMAESLWEYWPAVDHLEMAERNISLHFAVALWEHGYKLYAEASPAEDQNRKLDLFAYHPSTGTQVICEFKRAWDERAFPELSNDLERIVAFRPRTVLSGARFGVLGCISWKEELAKWWIQDEQTHPDQKERKAFYDRIQSHHPAWGGVQLQRYGNSKEAFIKANSHHFLYAAFSLE